MDIAKILQEVIDNAEVACPAPPEGEEPIYYITQDDINKLSACVERMKGNCKDCKHWKAHTDTYNKRWNTCEAPDWVDYDDKISDDDFAIYADAHDDSGLECGLKTGPMFRCDKFELTKGVLL